MARIAALLAFVLLSLPLGGCSRETLLNGLVPANGYTVHKNLAYGTDPRQKLDVYTPDAPNPNGCTVLFIYGGRWEDGDKELYKFVGQALTTKGCVTAVADYRVYPKAKYPAFVEDSARAFVWLHTHAREYGGNPNSLFIAGHSAGAYNAVMVAVHPRYLKEAGGQRRWIRGVIGISGPYDFLPFTDADIKDMFSPEKDGLTQPIHYAAQGLPPMLLVHGMNDTDVYPKNTVNFAKALRKTGNTPEVVLYKDATHKIIILSLLNGFRARIPLLEDMSRFINEKAPAR
ncbi:MAG: alpha/beta hydrolase [Micavibrio sp.]|nr:alpha/beta hydrolase [Micavibrio sp.]